MPMAAAVSSDKFFSRATLQGDTREGAAAILLTLSLQLSASPPSHCRRGAAPGRRASEFRAPAGASASP